MQTINRLETLPAWRDIAIVIAYDDPGGWYDHVMPPIVSQSDDAANDTLLGPGRCGHPKPGVYLDRCGHGLRLPVLAISPYTRPNSVDHQLLDQASLLRFIEDNWRLGRIGNQSFDATASPFTSMLDLAKGRRARALFLDPATGEPTSHR